MAEDILPQHRDEIDALLSLFPDWTTVLSKANGHHDNDPSENLVEREVAAAAYSGEEYAVVKILVQLNFPDSNRDCVVVEAWLDDESLHQEEANVDVGENGETNQLSRPVFERTTSGRRLHCQFSVIELPPIEFTIVLLPDYPKWTAPNFSLCASFLSNGQKTAVCKKLDELACANAGQPVILIWIDWLQNECIEFLGLSTVTLTTQESFDSVDCRIGDTDLSVIQRIHDMIRHDIEAERKHFNVTDHECPVCFDVFPGTDFFRLDSCRHYCCRGCILSYVEQGMLDGNVHCLKCPEDKCEMALPIPVIRAVLSEEQWQRWETLAFNRALDSMSDMDWCPRCQMPAVREFTHDHIPFAQCAYCMFVFCPDCKESLHQGRKCASLQEKLIGLSNAEPSEKEKSEEERRKVLQRKWNILSTLKIKESCKRCPACRVFIEKNFGCNKVSCTNCHALMCYRCGKQIFDYSHFGDAKCPLFDEHSYDAAPPPVHRRLPDRPPEAIVQMEAMLEANPELRRQLKRCPRCHQRNLKYNRNNHIRCWACNSNLCYLCRQLIIGPMKNHFGIGAGRCLQHSDD